MSNATAAMAAQVATESIPSTQPLRSMALSFRAHWPEYLMESAELALFMISACIVTAILEHPASPLRQVLPNDFTRRFITGLAMGITLLSLVHSNWGKRSGAHMNPAITLMFFRLGKIDGSDAAFYTLFQFIGGVAGVFISVLLVGSGLAHPSVNFAATQPGMSGTFIAFVAELLISFVLAITVLVVSNRSRIARFTPYFAASLVVAYITFEAPFSGMSMNPARTFGSAFPAHMFQALWIYFTAPPLAMLLAAELYVRAGSARTVYCAKLHHANSQRCIFRCRYAEMK